MSEEKQIRIFDKAFKILGVDLLVKAYVRNDTTAVIRFIVQMSAGLAILAGGAYVVGRAVEMYGSPAVNASVLGVLGIAIPFSIAVLALAVMYTVRQMMSHWADRKED